MKVENWSVAINRLAHLRRELQSGVDTGMLNRAYRIVGVSEFNYAELPMAWKRKVERNLLRGYMVARQGFNVLLTEICAAMVDVKIGYICPQYTDVMIPLGDRKADDVARELATLCGVTGKVGGLEFERSSGHNYMRVKGQSRSTGTDGPRYVEFKAYITELFDADEDRRIKAVEALRAAGKVRTAFKSY